MWWIIGAVVLIYMVVIPNYRGLQRSRMEDMQVAVLAKIMELPAPLPGHRYGVVHDEHVKLIGLLIDENRGKEPLGAFRKELERIREKSPNGYLIHEYTSFINRSLFPNVRWL